VLLAIRTFSSGASAPALKSSAMYAKHAGGLSAKMVPPRCPRALTPTEG
jgi:hypothetical protein